MGFGTAPLHRRVEPHAFHYLAQKTSFWLAIISLLAFVSGNMIGQHGWQVFLKSVLGHDNDSLIVYTGTVTPIALVPDYTRWTQYGGNPQEHSFREVPKDVLIPLPPYTINLKEETARAIYSVSYLGSYTTGKEASGSHPAVDIRVPIGTPVRAIAAGIVSEVKNASGFGKTVVIRHPNIPDPDHPNQTTVLYSNYAHLSTTFVTEGTVVGKGEQIALSGMTGEATGPHLHFQIDREDAPWHPYWPFTAEELRTVGYNTVEAINRGFKSERAIAFTVNPLLYTQADYRSNVTVAQSAASSTSSAMSLSWMARTQSRIAQRKSLRVALRTRQPVALKSAAISSSSSVVSSIPVDTAVLVVDRKEVVVSTADLIPIPMPASNVVSLDISHDGEFTERQWERVRLSLLDAQGNLVTNPALEQDIVLRTSFGSADFQPATLSILDFHNGRAEVSLLPHGRRAIIIEAMPFKAVSQPMSHAR